MQLSSILILAGAAIAAATPLAGQRIQARDPSDKSGNSYVVLHTQSGTYPTSLETSDAFFQNSIKYRGPDGVDRQDLTCTQPWTNKNCYVSYTPPPIDELFLSSVANKAEQQCTIANGQFGSNIVVQACWAPPAAPQISFTYNGHDYNTWSGQSTCGHVVDNKPFGGTEDATCYFNA